MKKCREITIVLLLAAVGAVSTLTAQADAVDEKVENLLERMTLEEKLGQMTLTSRKRDENRNPIWEPLLKAVEEGRCGNVLNVARLEGTRMLQETAVEKSRLGIPLLLGFDVVHGYETIFPIPLGMAASWDMAAVGEASRIAAVEASAHGICWTFAPMADVSRDPRWGRIAESPGEDPYLASRFAEATVRGFQRGDLARGDTVLSCPKHFIAYGAAKAGRDYNTVDTSERNLRRIYLPPFKAAIDAGAQSVMTAFNEWNDLPVTGNPFLLKTVLRSELGFDGLVVTDYTAIPEMINHGTARDDYEAAADAIDAGVEMDMASGVFMGQLEAAIPAGDVAMEQIDNAVRNILRVKYMLGLFDDPYLYGAEERVAEEVYSASHLDMAYDLACKSLVLLKNDANILPLDKGLDLAVIGPLADSRRDLLGCWRAKGDPDETSTVLEQIVSANTGGEVLHMRGCEVRGDDRSGFDAALNAANESDAVVMVLGETVRMSGEAASRTSINLPGVQSELLKEIAGTGKPVVLVLLNGRPLALAKEDRLCGAILEAWHPGSMGARSIADTLFGDSNPSGRLPVSFPRNLGQVPIHYSVKNTGRPIPADKPDLKYASRYIDAPNTPLYPFGYGLSYTTFEYGEPRIDKSKIASTETLRISVDVSNTGERDGIETVQLYVRDMTASTTRPLKELKGFKRVELRAGATREVRFVVGEEQLKFLRRDMTWGAEPGLFKLFVGPNSRDLQSVQFKLE